MELKLEGIVETLLVGAMASLLVMSVVFFAFGHIWNVRVMRRFFDTLFGERSGSESEDFSGKAIVADRDESGPSPATLRGASRSRKDNGGEGHLSFGLILLLALLYGLGIIAEAGSHAVTHEDNQAEKQRSFQIVALGKLASGTASHRLSRFISDYNACRNLKLRSSRDREHPPLPATRRSREPVLLQRKERGFSTEGVLRRAVGARGSNQFHAVIRVADTLVAL